MEYDVIVIGSGPAGLSAAIYAGRRKMKTLVIAMEIGGQPNETPKVENYPGYLSIAGEKLMQKFYKQAVKAGAEFATEEVKAVEEAEGKFLVKTVDKQFSCKALILAFGRTPRKLNVPGEEKFTGRGVSYCATCDMMFFKSKTIAVVGGGNSALDAAIYGSKVASQVYLIHRRGEFRAFESLVETAKKKSNIKFVLNSVVKEIRGNERVNSILVEDVNTHEVKELAVDGVFVEIGSEVDTSFVKHLVKVDENNQIVVNRNTETFYPDKDVVRPGIFAAGDVTNVPFKQIVVAAGDGCKAALQAYNYLHGLTPSISAEWSKH
jgi:thioredoxin-disulfide reductase